MIRNISSPGKKLFLTFDDGPDPEFTEAVLEVLSTNKVPATFFVIAQKAKVQNKLLQKVMGLGHAIGNHSLDHTYSVFFAKKIIMARWIEDSEHLLAELTAGQSVGFRPPNGICTPHLIQSLKEMNLPLILWNIRFYDTAFSWTAAKALKSLSRTQAGDIVLLHDSLRSGLRNVFLQTLDTYILAAKSAGFEFSQLTKENCSNII